MGEYIGFGHRGATVFHACYSLGCCGILCELCAYGIPMGLVGGTEYRCAVGGMGDYVGAFCHRISDQSCESDAFRLEKRDVRRLRCWMLEFRL